MMHRIATPGRLLGAWIGLVALVLLGGLLAPRGADAIGRDALNKGLVATVKLFTLLEGSSDRGAACSGTWVDASGLILTNFHCIGYVKRSPEVRENRARVGDFMRRDRMTIVFPTTDPREAPRPAYVAQYVAGSPEFDIAVLRLVGTFTGVDRQPGPLPSRLPITVIALGDSDRAQINDEINIVGYPGVGGPTITFTQGVISGFEDDSGDGRNDAFKVTAQIFGGNSGGLAMNEAGEQVGVPTYGIGGEAAGGFLNRVMMVNVAKPLISQALNTPAGGSNPPQGVATPTPPPPGPTATSPFGTIQFGNQMQDRRLAGVATSFPAGTRLLAAAFAVQGIRAGAAWGYAWIVNGEVVIDETAGNTWDAATTGTYCCLSLSMRNQAPLPNGRYELALVFNNAVVQRAGVTIGAGPSPPPTPQGQAGTLLQGRFVDADTKRPVPNGIIVVLNPGVTVQEFLNKRDVSLVAASAEGGADGTFQTAPPLAPGRYSVLWTAGNYRLQGGDGVLTIPEGAPAVVNVGDLAMKRQ